MAEEGSILNIIADLNSRARVLEERYNLLRERLLVVNQNMVEEYKRVQQDVKVINSDIKEIKNDIFTLKETMKHFIKEMESFARKDSIKVLEKYINMWNPLHFVTEKDVIELIKGHTREHEHKKKEIEHKKG